MLLLRDVPTRGDPRDDQPAKILLFEARLIGPPVGTVLADRGTSGVGEAYAIADAVVQRRGKPAAPETSRAFRRRYGLLDGCEGCISQVERRDSPEPARAGWQATDLGHQRLRRQPKSRFSGK